MNLKSVLRSGGFIGMMIGSIIAYNLGYINDFPMQNLIFGCLYGGVTGFVIGYLTSITKPIPQPCEYSNSEKKIQRTSHNYWNNI